MRKDARSSAILPKEHPIGLVFILEHEPRLRGVGGVARPSAGRAGRLEDLREDRPIRRRIVLRLTGSREALYAGRLGGLAVRRRAADHEAERGCDEHSKAKQK